MKRLKILFRVDAGNTIGTGHLYECLWLAEKTKVHGFFCIREHEKSKELIRQYGFPVLEIAKKEQNAASEYRKINSCIQRFKPDIIVIDIPHLTNNYVKKISTGNAKLVVFNALLHPVKADVHIATVFFPLKANKQFFGSQYILLRKSFSRQKPSPPSRVVKHILILFGGADPGNFTLKTLKALSDISKDFTVTVILGGAFAHTREVQSFLKQFTKPHKLFFNIRNDQPLINIMKRTDLAFVSGGYTTSELMRLGIPCIALSQNSIEEKMIFRNFPQNAFMNLGRGKNISARKLKKTAEELMRNFKKRATMSKEAAHVVDGKGIDRVFEIIKRS